MAWTDLEEEIANEFSALEGCYDPAAGLTLISRGQSASETAAQRAIRAERRASRWRHRLQRGDAASRCAEEGCHNLLSPDMARRLERHCSTECLTGVNRRQKAAEARAEQKARLIRLWDEAGTRLYIRRKE
jgi:hypothetical protein